MLNMNNTVYDSFIDALANLVTSCFQTRNCNRVSVQIVESIEEIFKKLTEEDYLMAESYLTEQLLGTKNYILIN